MPTPPIRNTKRLLMTSDARRQVLMLLAAFGLLVSLRRIQAGVPLSFHLSLPEQRALPKREALARDMRIYELALFQGSTLSWQSYRSIEDTCGDDRDDPLIAEACAIFDDALDHESDRHVIDDAIHLLTSDS
jgi:hypothetical protein